MSYCKLVIRAALAVAASLGIATSSWGGTATGSVIVNASVANNCTISSPTVNFGAYDGVSANLTSDLNNSSASFSVNCTKNAASVNIALGFGNNATGSQRAMKDAGTALLSYNIFLPNATTPSAGCTFPGTTIWADGTLSTSVLTPTGTTWGAGAANTKTFTLCGTVPAAQNPEAGSYTDTIVSTITF